MKRFLISNKRKRTTSPKSDPRGKTDNIPDQPLDSNNNFVESDGTAAISDGPTRPPRLEPAAAATVTDVEKDTVMDRSGSSTSESDGEPLTPRAGDVLPATGKPTAGAEEVTSMSGFNHLLMDPYGCVPTVLQLCFEIVVSLMPHSTCSVTCLKNTSYFFMCMSNAFG